MPAVLTFHGVGAPGPSVGAAEAAVWVGEERFGAILDAVADHRDVVLTFDDGNRSDVDLALPALRARGLGAIFFVVAGRLDEEGYLAADDVLALAEAGMRVGSHGMHHVPWRGLPAAALDEEVVGARERLEDVLGGPVDEVACPFGAYDRRVLRTLRAAGVRRVFTSDGGEARDGAWLVPRTTVRHDDGPELVGRVLAARAPGLRRRAELAWKRWR